MQAPSGATFIATCRFILSRTQCRSSAQPSIATKACRAQSHNTPTVCSRCLQLLGLRGREKYLEREVTAAYDTLAGTPLEEGYSPRVAEGRLAVLGQAVQHLRSTQGQAPRMGAGLEVEWDHLNGALALMQEVGGGGLQVEAWGTGCALEAVPRCHHGLRRGPRVQCLPSLRCSRQRAEGKGNIS